MLFFRQFRDLCDVISLLIHCPTEPEILLASDGPHPDFWLPSTKVPHVASSSYSAAEKLLKNIFNIHLPIRGLLQHTKVWIPNFTQPYLRYTIFEVVLKSDFKKKHSPVQHRWCNETDLLKLHATNSIRSPELFYFMTLAKASHLNMTNIQDYYQLGNYVEISPSILNVQNRSTDPLEFMLFNAEIEPGHQEVLYQEFLVLTFPALFLNLSSFTRLIQMFNWPKNEARNLFRSADVCNRNAISFREMLYFLAATEPNLHFPKECKETKCQFVFRYYDSGNRQALNHSDLINYFVTVNKTNKEDLNMFDIELKVNECFKSLRVPENGTINQQKFNQGVIELKIKGINTALISEITIQQFVNEQVKLRGRLFGRKPIDYNTNQSNSSSLLRLKMFLSSSSLLYSHDAFEYSPAFKVANHMLRLSNTGQRYQISRVLTPNKKVCEVASNLTLKTALITELERKKSNDTFDPETIVNKMIKTIKSLALLNKKQNTFAKLEEVDFQWGNTNKQEYYNQINSICGSVLNMFKEESPLLKLEAPVYILGDFHGNIRDLLEIETALWNFGWSISPSAFLFLGDYVDRGIFSIEVCAFLFGYKLLNPFKVYMLRGNHETRQVQAESTFLAECMLKFGAVDGKSLHETINKVFDHLPFAAIIDNRIFCCHGGIPPPWLCPTLASINKIGGDLSNPSDENPLACSLLWNDTLPIAKASAQLLMEVKANQGFATNKRTNRGQYFNLQALEKFLTMHGLSHFIQAHNVTSAGLSSQHNGQMFSVYASWRNVISAQPNSEEEVACVAVDHGKLRILRMCMNCDS